ALAAQSGTQKMAHPNPSRVIGSDAWMLEQQLRAEWEAAEWRRIRAETALPPPPQPGRGREKPWYEGGSIILKGLVRFGIGAFGGYLGYIAAANTDAGEFEIWLAVLTGFITLLALSAIAPVREFVALLAEIMRWTIITGVLVGTVWL